MESSPSINELAAALSKTQGAIGSVAKGLTNPFYKSKYAPLSACWDVIRKPLSDNGLSVTQTTECSPDAVIVVTTLMHNSGQWISSKLSMPPVKNDPQGIGSAITYARRYSLMGIVGIATDDDDDDGNAACGRGNVNLKPLPPVEAVELESFVRREKQDADNPTIKPVESVAEKVFHTDDEKLTNDQLGRIHKEFMILGYQEPEQDAEFTPFLRQERERRLAETARILGIDGRLESTKDISKKQAITLIGTLIKMVKEKEAKEQKDKESKNGENIK